MLYVTCPGDSMKRVAVLWSHLSGYMDASLRALQAKNCSIFISAYEPAASAPFKREIFSWIPETHQRWWPNGQVNASSLERALGAFKPDIILCSGWSNPAYLHVAGTYKNRAVRVLCFDTPWRDTPRQWLGRLWVSLRLKPNFELAFVPGERQFETALRFGFSPKRIITGLLAPDAALFRPRVASNIGWPHSFLYVGRLSPEKGITELARAYSTYRSQCTDPWPLIVAGTGSMADELGVVPGVTMLGFVQPCDLPGVLHSAGCLVVPSLYEPWGVQISEGVAAGLPIIATTTCGASVHLVRPNFNGYVVEAGDVSGLARAMSKMSSNPGLTEFSNNSCALATQYTPDLFAANLLEGCSPHLVGEGRQASFALG